MTDTPNLSEREEHIQRYKTILKDVVDRRPSGIRLKIAESIARNKSFVSQITNPGYKTPVPERHLDLIFEVAHFTPEEKARFLESYWLAHPRARGRVHVPRESNQMRTLRIDMVALDSAADEARVDQLVRDFARRVSEAMKARG
ncbi:MAG: hypothetical protein WDN24_11365 [Sphingomonas sp.]